MKVVVHVVNTQDKFTHQIALYEDDGKKIVQSSPTPYGYIASLYHDGVKYLHSTDTFSGTLEPWVVYEAREVQHEKREYRDHIANGFDTGLYDVQGEECDGSPYSVYFSGLIRQARPEISDEAWKHLFEIEGQFRAEMLLGDEAADAANAILSRDVKPGQVTQWLVLTPEEFEHQNQQ